MIGLLLKILYCCLASFSCAIFWRIGGDGMPMVRKWGVPGIIGVSVAVLNPSYLALLYIPLGFLAIQWFSYGENAPIQNFWEKLLGESTLTEVFTRATCAFLWAIPALLLTRLFWLPITFFQVCFIGLAGGLLDDAEISEWTVGALFSMWIWIVL